MRPFRGLALLLRGRKAAGPATYRDGLRGPEKGRQAPQMTCDEMAVAACALARVKNSHDPACVLYTSRMTEPTRKERP